jgi:hypothetical protein
VKKEHRTLKNIVEIILSSLDHKAHKSSKKTNYLRKGLGVHSLGIELVISTLVLYTLRKEELALGTLVI